MPFETISNDFVTDNLMERLPLVLEKEHVFVCFGTEKILLDTGAPCSFHSSGAIGIGDNQFPVPSTFMGQNSDGLSQLVGVDTVGLLGVDILNQFDIIMDLPGASVTFSKAPLENNGCHVPLTDFLGIPICEVKIGESHLSAFFDTGAPISYFEAAVLECFSGEGNVTDFYPGIGRFDVETYRAEIEVGRKLFHLRSAVLPSDLGLLIIMASARGIVGNELMRDRAIGYFPRRRVLTL